MNFAPWFPPHTPSYTTEGAYGAHDTHPTTRVPREAPPLSEVPRTSPARASSRQRSLEAMERALIDLGLPETLAVEVQWRLKRMGKLLGKIFGLMFPPV